MFKSQLCSPCLRWYSPSVSGLSTVFRPGTVQHVGESKGPAGASHFQSKVFRPVRFYLNLTKQFIEPEALAQPRHWKSASASGSVNIQLISIVQVEVFSFSFQYPPFLKKRDGCYENDFDYMSVGIHFVELCFFHASGCPGNAERKTSRLQTRF